MFKCQECGKKFKTAKAAEKAANDGCPKCGGVDIDVSSFDVADTHRKKIAAADAKMPAALRNMLSPNYS